MTNRAQEPTDPLSDSERLLVQLLDAGFTRWRIAQLTHTYQDDVRNDIFDLCARYDSNAARLPDRVRATGEPVPALTAGEISALINGAATPTDVQET